MILRPLTLADLPLVTPWFEDADTQRYLGGPDWPAVMLDHAQRSTGTVFRGATQLGSYHYLALMVGRAIGYIDCGIFDRCTVYGGEARDGPIIVTTIEAVTGAIAFAVDPTQRRRGLATSMIQLSPGIGTSPRSSCLRPGSSLRTRAPGGRSRRADSASRPRCLIVKACSTTAPSATAPNRADDPTTDACADHDRGPLLRRLPIEPPLRPLDSSGLGRCDSDGWQSNLWSRRWPDLRGFGRRSPTRRSTASQ